MYSSHLYLFHTDPQPKLTLVPLSASSLHTDNAYILDAGTVLYVWEGDGCTSVVLHKAMLTAKTIAAREIRSKRVSAIHRDCSVYYCIFSFGIFVANFHNYSGVSCSLYKLYFLIFH